MKTSKFKMTEVGPIPEDWEVKRLGEIWSSFKTGPFGSSLHAQDYVENGTPLINPMHIQDGKIEPSPDMTVDDATKQRLSAYKLSQDDIIIGRRGEMGRAALVGKKEIGWLCGTGCFFLHLDESCCPNYIALYLRTPASVVALEGEAVGTTLVNLNRKILGDLKLPLPPLAEQRRIAGALSDVDELILALGKLIEKKRNIKTGAMQELLGMRNEECGMRNVPRRRLVGFSGEWVEKRVGDCGFCFNGITGKAGNDFGHGEAHYITFLNVLSNVVIDTDMLDAVDIKSGENQNEVRCGDLFFNTSSETPEEVGFCAVLDEEVTSVYLNSFCFGFRLTDDNVSGKFLAYWFRATGGRTLMTFLAQGSTRYNLSKDAFREACISIPPTLAEQQAIAAVLSDMDAEIAALEAKRAKYESIKQGMMQELLTGRTRLKGE